MKLLKVIKFVHEAESEKLKEFTSGLSHQQNSLLYKLQHTPNEPNTKSHY
jgi:hypothetical protein